MAQSAAKEDESVPTWLVDLEKRLKTVPQSHQLGHEVGAGSICVNCHRCPGLELHYWRKQCIQCKCKKENHDIPPDDSILRFEILLTNPGSKRFKSFYEDLEMQQQQNNNAALNRLAHYRNSLQSVPFEWLPLDTPNDLALAYMSALPSDKIPISGNEGAKYRQIQLGKQIPLYDISPEVRHRLSSEEKKGFLSYLGDLRNSVGLGVIKRICQISHLEKSVPQYPLQRPVMANNLGNKYGKKGACNQLVAKNPGNAYYQPIDLPDKSNCTEIEGGMKTMGLNNSNQMSLKPTQQFHQLEQSPTSSIYSSNPSPGLNNNNQMNLKPTQQFHKFKQSPTLGQTSSIYSSNASPENPQPTSLKPPSAFVQVYPKGVKSGGFNAEAKKFPENAFLSEPKSVIIPNYLPGRDDFPNVTKVALVPNFISEPHSLPPHRATETRPQAFHCPHSEKPKTMPHYERNVQLGFDSHPENYTAIEKQDLFNSLNTTNLDLVNANKDYIENVIPAETKLECWNCKKPLPFGSVAIVADRAGNDKVWHPKCFVCCECEELLVDLLYFYHNEQLYCGRHYAEKKNIPRCFTCDELIFANEYTYAESKSFHLNHFCCLECDLQLAGGDYIVTNDGQPCCVNCFNEKYAEVCQSCKCRIQIHQRGMKFDQSNWHATAECFKCARCGKSLVNSHFKYQNSKPYCTTNCV